MGENVNLCHHDNSNEEISDLNKFNKHLTFTSGEGYEQILIEVTIENSLLILPSLSRGFHG